MGIYDRDYYRRDVRPPVEGTPGKIVGLSITAWLIIANVVVFLFSMLVLASRDPMILDWWARTLFLWPNLKANLVDPFGQPFGVFRPWQTVTCMFLHAGILHILFNMWFLWLFGRALEQLYGRWNFLAFYMAAGIVASLLFVLTSLFFRDPNAAVGASGAVMGVVVLYAFRFPRQRVYIWGVLPVRIWQLAAFFVVLDLLGFMSHSETNTVANAAHLGGAAFGMMYNFIDLRFERFGRLFKSRPKRPDPSHPFPPLTPTQPSGPPVDADVRRRVDTLLDKISREGLTGLTDEEREFLRDASGKYRSS